MNQGDQSHYAGRDTADLAKPDAHVNHDQQSGQSHREDALGKEAVGNGRADGIGIAQLHFIVRISLYEAVGQGLLGLGGDRLVAHQGDDQLGGGAGYVGALGNRYIFLKLLGRQALHLVQRNLAGIGIGKPGAALEVYVHVHAENNGQDNAHHNDRDGNDEILLEVFNKPNVCLMHS